MQTCSWNFFSLLTKFSETVGVLEAICASSYDKCTCKYY